MANQGPSSSAGVSAAPSIIVSSSGPSCGRGPLRRGANALFRSGIQRRGVNCRNFRNPIARRLVLNNLRDCSALAIRQQADRDAKIGKWQVKFETCNTLVTFNGGTTAENVN